eukprot:359937-Chlamydomonas_euryale.AAC.5
MPRGVRVLIAACGLACQVGPPLVGQAAGHVMEGRPANVPAAARRETGRRDRPRGACVCGHGRRGRGVNRAVSSVVARRGRRQAARRHVMVTLTAAGNGHGHCLGRSTRHCDTRRPLPRSLLMDMRTQSPDDHAHAVS